MQEVVLGLWAASAMVYPSLCTSEQEFWGAAGDAEAVGCLCHGLSIPTSLCVSGLQLAPGTFPKLTKSFP